MKTGSDNLVNFSDCSLNVCGEDIAGPGELAEWPIQQQQCRVAGLFNSHGGHQDLGSNGQVANAAGRPIGEGR